jgi:type IV secretory pathway TrbD component
MATCSKSTQQGMKECEQKRAPCWHTLAGISIFFLLMWVTGAVLLSVGVTMKRDVSHFDPLADFMPNGKCVVTNVTHVAEQRHDKDPYCVDVYTYTFRSGDAAYTSGADEKKHNKGTKCESSRPLPATHEVGQETPCWRPAVNDAVLELASFYKCGNTRCIKILDPADEYNTKVARAALFFILGVAFLTVGLTMWCVLVALIVRAIQKERASVGINEIGDIKCSTTGDAVYQKA